MGEFCLLVELHREGKGRGYNRLAKHFFLVGAFPPRDNSILFLRPLWSHIFSGNLFVISQFGQGPLYMVKKSQYFFFGNTSLVFSDAPPLDFLRHYIFIGTSSILASKSFNIIDSFGRLSLLQWIFILMEII